MLRKTMLASVLLTATLGVDALGQSGGGDAELYMTGLAGPVGLEVDGRARAWLSQMGAPVLPGNGPCRLLAALERAAQTAVADVVPAQDLEEIELGGPVQRPHQLHDLGTKRSQRSQTIPKISQQFP